MIQSTGVCVYITSLLKSIKNVEHFLCSIFESDEVILNPKSYVSFSTNWLVHMAMHRYLLSCINTHIETLMHHNTVELVYPDYQGVLLFKVS